MLRQAQEHEAEQLTQIARVAKAHWGYDSELLKSWESVLTFTPEYIRTHWVAVVEADDAKAEAAKSDSTSPGISTTGILGVCGLSAFGKQLEIDHMWVLPQAMGRGVGRQLVAAALKHCREQKVDTLRLLSDPYATDFYLAMGAVHVGQQRTLPAPQGRLLPLMHFKVSEDCV